MVVGEGRVLVERLGCGVGGMCELVGARYSRGEFVKVYEKLSMIEWLSSTFMDLFFSILTGDKIWAPFSRR